MEFNYTCPCCGKEQKITITDVEPEISENTVVTKERKTETWAEIAENIKNDPYYYEIGTEIQTKLEDGTDITFVVAANDVYGGHTAFVTKDCLPCRHSMNDDNTNDGGFTKSKMCEYLNPNVFVFLPKDLKKEIYPRLFISGEDDGYLRLWLLSATELGLDSRYTENDRDIENDSNYDVHFPLFSDKKSRVKQINGETTCYWTRTPYGTSSFVYVSGSGNSYGNVATYSYGVAFGFLI